MKQTRPQRWRVAPAGMAPRRPFFSLITEKRLSRSGNIRYRESRLSWMSMRDDPTRPHHDPDFASWHDWEIEHVVDKLCRDFPNKTRPFIERIVDRCKETIQASSGRERLIDCARRNLS